MSVLATDLALAVVLGGAFGLGVCLLLALVPRWGAPSLTRRVAPYLRDITDPRGLAFTPEPFGLRALLREERDRWVSRVGGSASIERRLRQAARETDAAGFRGRQLTWAVVGVAAGGALVVALVLLGTAAPAAALIPPLFGLIAAIGYDQLLSFAARKRVVRIQDELPTLLEFLALCLSAGEGIFEAIRRVAGTGAGELSAELRTVVVAVGTGSSLTDALNRLSRDLELPALTRSVDQLIAAIERGAPLADVLHAQALDAREDAKRTLIEQAGRKEIYMLVPVNTELSSLAVGRVIRRWEPLAYAGVACAA